MIMKKIKYLLFVVSSFFALFYLSQCVYAGKNSEPMKNLPTVKLSIGMPIKDLRLGSTLPFTYTAGLNEAVDTEMFYITQPYNFIYVDGDKELKLENIAGPNFFSAIMVRSGVVDQVSVTVQNDKLTLDEAMQKAESMFNWFDSVGFKKDIREKAEAFYIRHSIGKPYAAPITSFKEAAAALLDTQAKIEEMQLFSLAKNEVGLSLTLSNARRKKAEYGKEYDNESHNADEREYYLEFFIAKIIELPPKPQAR